MPSASKPATSNVLDYLDSLPEWSRMLCSELRRIILAADPSLTEEWKWGPHYSGNGMVCGWGAFQKHVKLTFFNGSAMPDSAGLFNHCTDNEFSRSIKFNPGDALDEALLTAYVRASVAVNKTGFRRVVAPREDAVPDDLLAALRNNKAAGAFFDALTPGYKREYIELVTSAKQEKTRLARIEKVLAACAAGRKPNDQYKK
ncbi:YdeI/OmpD-associated family protein [Flaviaesturariibacter amylovorans]|uniref:YdhG-like domain-containing protein n=1 Tax=Flaviaesturariibacter amylovorans TaxID=1084520 RepID=A0ABP8HTN7_9BACT